jgi:hypothetical protein
MAQLSKSLKLHTAIIGLSTLLGFAAQSADQIKLHFPVTFQDSVKIIADVSGLPVPLVRMHEISVTEGLCESDWPLWLESEGVWNWPVDAYTQIYALPCPQVSGLVFWRLYTSFAEKGGLFRLSSLPQLDLEKRWSSSSVIQNWSWQPTTEELKIAYQYDGRSDCGSLHVYKWSPTQFTFQLVKVFLKPICDGDSHWPLVYPNDSL